MGVETFHKFSSSVKTKFKLGSKVVVVKVKKVQESLKYFVVNNNFNTFLAGIL